MPRSHFTIFCLILTRQTGCMKENRSSIRSQDLFCTVLSVYPTEGSVFVGEIFTSKFWIWTGSVSTKYSSHWISEGTMLMINEGGVFPMEFMLNLAFLFKFKIGNIIWICNFQALPSAPDRDMYDIYFRRKGFIKNIVFNFDFFDYWDVVNFKIAPYRP